MPNLCVGSATVPVPGRPGLRSAVLDDLDVPVVLVRNPQLVVILM